MLFHYSSRITDLIVNLIIEVINLAVDKEVHINPSMSIIVRFKITSVMYITKL
jgi:hypothetical protein